MPSFGDRLKAYRKAAGLTQVELGKKIHKSAQVISNLERGYTTGMTVNDYQIIANALGVPINRLVLDIGPNEGFFENLEVTRSNTPPSGLSPKEERDIESDLEDMMNSMASAAYEGDKDNEEDIEILKATLKAAMMQAKKVAKKKYTPKKYRRD